MLSYLKITQDYSLHSSLHYILRILKFVIYNQGMQFKYSLYLRIIVTKILSQQYFYFKIYNITMIVWCIHLTA